MLKLWLDITIDTKSIASLTRGIPVRSWKSHDIYRGYFNLKPLAHAFGGSGLDCRTSYFYHGDQVAEFLAFDIGIKWQNFVDDTRPSSIAFRQRKTQGERERKSAMTVFSRIKKSQFRTFGILLSLRTKNHVKSGTKGRSKSRRRQISRRRAVGRSLGGRERRVGCRRVVGHPPSFQGNARGSAGERKRQSAHVRREHLIIGEIFPSTTDYPRPSRTAD